MDNTGKHVKVHYIGTLDDGTVFDSSRERDEPLAFVCMAGQMIPGFDKAVVNMEIGETRTVRLEPEDAYGQPSDDAIQRIPINALPGAEKLSVGAEVALQGPDGIPHHATVIEMTDSDIVFDMNHPLAGKPLNFEITLLEAE
ncbi:FKBP-type peptidyl-prolyl cis-trans isomerase [Adlercreutzia murintestinalis]|uniref:FKBP-type peptidyl-prolyl cis-trans isomerase n=1 Tax=Adlercreutzia murintestinalis TaxID=2941325 RepID=UPI00203D9874|nr:peptidylprolyl isomerase [Adlercreutzia murintestinalis]